MMEEVKRIIDALTCTSKKGFPCGSCKYFIRGDSVDRCDEKQKSKDAASLIEKQDAEIVELREKLDEAKIGLIWYSMLDKVGELIDENERLKNRVYNLTTYLRESMDATHGTVGFAVRNVLDERHPGLPGYNPAILEVRNEHTV